MSNQSSGNEKFVSNAGKLKSVDEESRESCSEAI